MMFRKLLSQALQFERFFSYDAVRIYLKETMTLRLYGLNVYASSVRRTKVTGIVVDGLY